MTRSLLIMNEEGWPGIARGVDLLRADTPPLDVIEESIKLTERDSGVHTVGYNSPPNANGVMQLDASIMNGDTLQIGAVGALEGIMHPISVAREVMRRLPHVMLVGAGARLFAEECGYTTEDLLSPDAAIEYSKWKSSHAVERLIDLFQPEKGEGSHGTVIALARDTNGSFAGGVSTSGWDYKYPGRLGDSPIIGAGLYVDSRFGAAACTHCGENAIRTSLARSVVLYMKKGASVKEAVREGMDDLSGLQGGFQGQVVIYATDSEGDFFVARRLKRDDSCDYLVWTDSMSAFEKRAAEDL